LSSQDRQPPQQDATDVGGSRPSGAGDAATLAAGTSVGNHRIDEVLGRGGMGIVYRATDTRLSRAVAIKFLSIELADAQAKRRFEQEAQTASGLNHPHIVAVHDVGEHDGRQYIVSELVDGGTLDDWAMANPRRTWRQSVELLTGIASALAAAHSAGVLHRDVKPGNILIGRNGYAKLADFGLAKLVDTRAAASPRGETHNTRAGVVVGTVAYMSPEQAAGQPLDGRSDVFSFGLVLYELLARRRPFDGANDLETLKAIAHATPEPLPADMPEMLRSAIEKALEKDPADRYQTMQDLVADLRRVARKQVSSQSAVTVSSDAQAVAAIVKRHRGVVVAAGAAATLAVVGLTYFAIARVSPPAAPAATTSGTVRDYEIAQLTTTGNAVTPAISPDGRWVVYVQRGGSVSSGSTARSTSLWVRQIATSSNVQVVPAEPGVVVSAPTVSPDGNFIDYLRRDQRVGTEPALWRVPFLGGPGQRIADEVLSPVGWSPDGKQMASVRGTSRGTALVVADPSGQERVLAERAPPRWLVNVDLVGDPQLRPSWSPDGKTIALFELNEGLEPRAVFVDVASGAETTRDSQGAYVTRGVGWLGPSSLVVSQPQKSGRPVQLWRMSYPEGAIAALTNDLASYFGVDLDAARGSLVTSRRDTRSEIWVAGAAGENAMQVVPPAPYGATNLFISWAGDRLLYGATINGRASIASIVAGGVSEEVVPDAFHGAASPDGGTIVFARSARGIDGGLWKIDAEHRQPVLLAAGVAAEPVVTADGSRVVFFSTRSGFASRWIVSIEGGDAHEIMQENTGEGAFDVAPDGRTIVFGTVGGGKRRLVVCELPACTNRRELDPPRDATAPLRWTPDGREIAYLDSTSRNILALPIDGGAPHALTRFAEGDGPPIVSYEWSRDGRRLALARMTTSEDIVLLSGLRP
jgi:Tol biopolymer transport system component